MLNPLLLDPSGTSLLRRQFAAELNRRYKSIQHDLYQLVVLEDAFGLALTTNTRFAFQSNPAKLSGFKKWLKQKVEEEVLSLDATKYITSAYQQALSRAYLQARAKDAADDEFLNYVLTSRERFVRVTLSQAQTVHKLQILYTRAYDHLDGVTAQMSVQMGRVLGEGLIAKRSPRTIAAQLSKVVGISKERALLISRTELVNANSEGLLDAFESLGITKLGIQVEWTTTGNPCPRCQVHEGNVYTIDQAHGLIPAHPRCLCSFTIYAEPVVKRKRRRRLTPSR